MESYSKLDFLHADCKKEYGLETMSLFTLFKGPKIFNFQFCSPFPPSSFRKWKSDLANHCQIAVEVNMHSMNC